MLESRRDFCQAGEMERKPRAAGGLFVLLGFIAGVFIGSAKGEPIIGALSGIGLGLALAALVWRQDLRRP